MVTSGALSLTKMAPRKNSRPTMTNMIIWERPKNRPARLPFFMAS